MALFKILSEPIRLEILKYLAIVCESDVSGIAERFPQDQSVISRHLKLMHEEGILRCSRESRHVYYSVNGEDLLDKFEKITKQLRVLLEMTREL